MTRIEEGFQFLKLKGLNLIAVIDCEELPERTSKFMAASGIPVSDYRRLVLIGHGGRQMWRSLKVSGMTTADPIDHYSVSLTQRFIKDYLDASPLLWLYPNTHLVTPLQQLGEAAGWSHPSPLGSGISPEYGVWFAYRAAFLIDADLPLQNGANAVSPCDNCIDKPCIGACPAAAVRAEQFGLEACAHHRLKSLSSCTDRCLARLACPIHPEHRYTLDQVQYHYRNSLATLREWYRE
ncbi:MAG: hypothetical protein KDI49_20045 [Gammaproteobacteria bacterium]|nr:hypothetical protein [Gammaproteobacteria bacterium]